MPTARKLLFAVVVAAVTFGCSESDEADDLEFDEPDGSETSRIEDAADGVDTAEPEDTSPEDASGSDADATSDADVQNCRDEHDYICCTRKVREEGFYTWDPDCHPDASVWGKCPANHYTVPDTERCGPEMDADARTMGDDADTSGEDNDGEVMTGGGQGGGGGFGGGGGS